MSAVLNARQMLREMHTIGSREYCCYFKGNCSDDRKADLIFFNGLFSGANSWAYQTRLPALLKDYRMVMFDYPCQGGSTQVTQDMTPSDMVKDITVLLNRLNVKKPMLIGHSLGGMLAGLLTGLQATEPFLPTDIQGLLIANSSIKRPDSTASMFDDIQTQLLNIHTSCTNATDTRNAIKDLFRSFILGALGNDYQDKMKPFMDDLLEGYADYNPNPQALAYLLSTFSQQAIVKIIAKQLMEKARCPVRVIAGANDTIFPPAQAKELADVFENSDFFTIPDAGHSVMLEQSRAFNELLLEFVERVYMPTPVTTTHIQNHTRY